MTPFALADGRRLATWAAGDGEPLVVIESGLGLASAEWAAVQHGIADFTAVLRYDRAGLGASDPPRHRPRRLDELVDDLEALLRAPGRRAGPCLVVGHSLGAVVARRLAARRPKDVGALLLVEPMHERQFETLGPLFPPPGDGDSPVLRAMRRFFLGGWREPGRNAEAVDLAEAVDGAPAAGALGELPMVVLGGEPFRDPRLFPPPHGEHLAAGWSALQEATLALSCRSEHRPLGAEAGHHVQRDAPQAVVEVVRELVERLRAPTLPSSLSPADRLASSEPAAG